MEVKCDGKDILRCMIHVHVHSMQFNMDGWYTQIVGNNGLGDGFVASK
jgi:hypothetical protein